MADPELVGRSDIQGTPVYEEVAEWMRRIWAPGFGEPFDPDDLDLSPDQTTLAFTVEIRGDLERPPQTSIAILNMTDLVMRVLPSGKWNDRCPRWSPDGRRLAFLSDRGLAEVFQVWFGDPAAADFPTTPGPPINGTAEFLAWSPSGEKLLIGVSGLDAEIDGDRGSKTATSDTRPTWMPRVDAGNTEDKARRLWTADAVKGTSQVVSTGEANVWEAAWVDDGRIGVLFSSGVSESSWYEARVGVIDLATGVLRTVFEPADQAQLQECSPDGRYLAVVCAIASDRGRVAGDLVLVDTGSGEGRKLETAGVDVTSAFWRSSDRLLFAGPRRMETVVAETDLDGQIREIWSGSETLGRFYPVALPCGEAACVCVVESWQKAPEIGRAEGGRIERLTRFAHEGSEFLAKVGGTPRVVEWQAPDGLVIEGWLFENGASEFQPLALEIHGGPVWLARNRWSARNILLPLLVSRGFAVLQPNFRGSNGRGYEFVSLIKGDMGGDDVADCLAGVAAMVAAGVADPARLVLFGGSYGGFLTSLIITIDDRFAAGVALSPVTDWWSQHGTSNIGAFDRLFLDDDPFSVDGKYVQRSPARHVRQAQTPLLTVIGSKDRAAPPGQGWQMHTGLLEAGVESVLVEYPEEGHGVRTYPALTDYCARALMWFESHLPRAAGGSPVAAGE